MDNLDLIEEILSNIDNRQEVLAQEIQKLLNSERGDYSTIYSTVVRDGKIYIRENRGSTIEEEYPLDRYLKLYPNSLQDIDILSLVTDDLQTLRLKRDTLRRKYTDFKGLFENKPLKERYNIINRALEIEGNYLLSNKLIEKKIRVHPSTIGVYLQGSGYFIDKKDSYINKVENPALGRLTYIVNSYNNVYPNFVIETLEKKLLSSNDLSIVYEEANKEIIRLRKDYDIDGKFSTERKKNCIDITFRKEKATICMTPYGPVEKNIPKDIRSDFTLLLDILSYGISPDLQGYKDLRLISPIEEKDIDKVSLEMQDTYGRTLLYSFLAHRYGYCIPYMLEIEYRYNSVSKGCKLTKEQIKKLSIKADTVSCSIEDVRPYENCQGEKDLIILYTKVLLPERVFDGEEYDAYTDNHISILLVDQKKREIDYFEPLGKGEISITCEECIEKWLKEKYPSFSIKLPQTQGLQCLISEGSCFVVNLLYLYLKMTNKTPIEEIIEQISKDPSDLQLLMRKFLHLLNDITKEHRVEELVEIYAPYEEALGRLSLSDPEYKEEVRRAQKLYRELDIEKMKELIQNSVYTSRNLPLEDNPINIMILAYSAPHSREELLSYDESTLISAAELIVNQKVDISRAQEILSYPIPYTLEKAAKDDMVEIVELLLRDSKNPIKEAIQLLRRKPSRPIREYLNNLLSSGDPQIYQSQQKKHFVIVPEKKVTEEVIDPVTQEDLRDFPSKDVIVIDQKDYEPLGKYVKYYLIESILSTWENGYSLYDPHSVRIVPQYPKDVYGDMEPVLVRSIYETALSRDSSVSERYPLTASILRRGRLLESLYHFIQYYNKLTDAYDKHTFPLEDTDQYNRRDLRAIDQLNIMYILSGTPNFGFRKYMDVPSEAGRNGTQVFLSCFLVSFFLSMGFYIYHDKSSNTFQWRKGKEECSKIRGNDLCRPCLKDERVYVD